jgi:hypothetical protein
MLRAAGMCLSARGDIALRRVACPLESLGAASSNLMARHRGLLLTRRAGAQREATARTPFHLRGEGENSPDDGFRCLQQTHRMEAAGRRLSARYNYQEESLVMGDVTEIRPLVLGYAQLGPFADEAQLTAVQARLNTYAQQAGLKLGTVYFERTDTAPAIFTDLLAAVVRNRVTGVVVPSLRDFGDLADERVTELEDGLSIVVHEADPVSVHDPRD